MGAVTPRARRRRSPIAFPKRSPGPGAARPHHPRRRRHSRAGVGDVEVHRVPEVAARGPAVHRQLLLVQVESHQRRRPEQRWQEEQRALPAAGPPAAEGQHPRRLRGRLPLAQRSRAQLCGGRAVRSEAERCGAGRRGAGRCGPAAAVRGRGAAREARPRSAPLAPRGRRARAPPGGVARCALPRGAEPPAAPADTERREAPPLNLRQTPDKQDTAWLPAATDGCRGVFTGGDVGVWAVSSLISPDFHHIQGFELKSLILENLF